MKLVFTAPSEPEGKMMQEILTNAGVKSELSLFSDGLEALRARTGGATFPGEIWRLSVPDELEAKAKELLPI